jgi:hypothetical protein
MSSEIRDFFFEFFFEILKKNKIFLISGMYVIKYVYNPILGKITGKACKWPKNIFKMVLKLHFFFWNL